jgi:hypothetical protein
VRAAQPDLKLKPLTPRQANALQMTLDGYRKNEICDKLGITQKTLWTWRRLPAWNEQLDIAVRDSSGDGEVHIRTLLPLATVALKKLILTGADNVMLGAARTVLEAHANLVAREQDQAVMAELEARLEELQAVATNRLPAAANGAIEVDFVAHAHDPAHSDLEQGGNAQ